MNFEDIRVGDEFKTSSYMDKNYQEGFCIFKADCIIKVLKLDLEKKRVIYCYLTPDKWGNIDRNQYQQAAANFLRSAALISRAEKSNWRYIVL